MEAMKKGGKVKQKQKQKQKQHQTVNVYVGTRKGTRKPRKTQPPPFRPTPGPSFALQDPGFIRLMNPQMPGQQSQLLPPVQPLLSTPSGLNEPVGPQPLPQLSQPVGPQPLPSFTPVPPQYPPPVPLGRNRKSPLSPVISSLVPVLPAPLPLNIENASPSAPIPLENAPLSAPIPLEPKIREPGAGPKGRRTYKPEEDEKEVPLPKSKSPLYQPGSDIEDEEKEPLSMVAPISASEVGPSSMSEGARARSMYVEPDPLSPDFAVNARVPLMKAKPKAGSGKLGWSEYYYAVKGGFDRAKQLLGTRDKDDPNVKQFFGMVYQQYLKYLAS